MSTSLKELLLKVTPTLFNNIQGISDFKQLKTLVIGGETFPSKCKSIKKLIQNGVNVFNIYGLTELSCWSSCHLVKEIELE